MPYYQITNTSSVGYSDSSLTLAAGATTTLNVPTLPISLNAAIVAETLVVANLGTTLGGGSGDVVTDILEVTYPASLTSQIIAAVQATRLPPGVVITNNTYGDVGIKADPLADATWSNADDILRPGETTTVTAGYTGAIKAICESAVGGILVKVFY